MAKLTGNLIKFTWTPGGGGETLVTTRGFSWTYSESIRDSNTTPEQSPLDEEYTPGTRSGTIVARLFVDGSDATPPIPTGVTGTAVLFPNYTVSGKKYTVTAFCKDFRIVAASNTGGEPDVVEYVFRVTTPIGNPNTSAAAVVA